MTEYLQSGDTGLYVSRLSLGCMTFMNKDNAVASVMSGTRQKVADQMVGAAIDAGINLFDTSNSYGMGESEQIPGKALSGKRQDCLIATKVSRPMDDSANAIPMDYPHWIPKQERGVHALREPLINYLRCYCCVA